MAGSAVKYFVVGLAVLSLHYAPLADADRGEAKPTPVAGQPPSPDQASAEDTTNALGESLPKDADDGLVAEDDDDEEDEGNGDEDETDDPENVEETDEEVETQQEDEVDEGTGEDDASVSGEGDDVADEVVEEGDSSVPVEEKTSVDEAANGDLWIFADKNGKSCDTTCEAAGKTCSEDHWPTDEETALGIFLVGDGKCNKDHVKKEQKWIKPRAKKSLAVHPSMKSGRGRRTWCFWGAPKDGILESLVGASRCSVAQKHYKRFCPCVTLLDVAEE